MRIARSTRSNAALSRRMRDVSSARNPDASSTASAMAPCVAAYFFLPSVRRATMATRAPPPVAEAERLVNPRRHRHVGRGQVRVERHERAAGADGDGAGARVRVGGTEVGRLRGILADELA